jgi:chaperone modulatory protein CbpM
VRISISDEVWLHEDCQLSLAELARLASIPEPELRVWVEEGWLIPRDPRATDQLFGSDRLVMLRKAFRLRRDFELEPLALGLVVQLLDRIEELERELSRVRASLPGVLR